MKLIEITDLSVQYGSKLILQNINLSLADGEIVTIVGPNGSGKTTLIMCISNNFIGNTFNSNIRRKDTSLMEIGSSPSLMPELSLLENIKYFRKYQIFL